MIADDGSRSYCRTGSADEGDGSALGQWKEVIGIIAIATDIRGVPVVVAAPIPPMI